MVAMPFTVKSASLHHIDIECIQFSGCILVVLLRQRLYTDLSISDCHCYSNIVECIQNERQADITCSERYSEAGKVAIPSYTTEIN